VSNIGTVPPWEFTQTGSFPAPYSVPIPASLEVQPYTATATFDGSGSAGKYIPTITIIGPGGEKLARVQPQTTVAHGASASCTWLPPFGAAASSPSSPAGIQFNTDNEGGYLDITTNAEDSSSKGMNLEDTTAGGILMAATEGGITLNANAFGGAGGLLLECQNAFFQITPAGHGTTLTIETTANGWPIVIQSHDEVQIQSGNSKPIQLLPGASANCEVHLTAGQMLTVFNDSSNPIFEVRDDGSLHGQTGQSLTFDL